MGGDEGGLQGGQQVSLQGWGGVRVGGGSGMVTPLQGGSQG